MELKNPLEDKTPASASPGKLSRIIIGVSIVLASVTVIGVFVFGGLGFGETKQLSEVVWILPTAQSLMFLASIALAVLLLGRYLTLGKAWVFWSGTLFLANGILGIFYMLAWPGLRGDQGIIAVLPNTSAWLAEMLFSLVALQIVAVVARRPVRLKPVHIFAWYALAITLPILAGLLSVQLESKLPTLIRGTSFMPLLKIWSTIIIIVTLIAAVLAYRRFKAGEDAMLGYLALFLILFGFGIIHPLIGGKRYDYWWYVSRIELVASYLILFFGLLQEGYTLFGSERRLAEERRRYLEALRENEERLRLAQEAGHIGVWERNLITDELRWTPELEAIYGVKPGSIRTYHQDFSTKVHPDDLKMIDAKRAEAISQQKTFEYEFRIQRPNGETGWVYCRGAAIYDLTGQPTRVFGVNIDITERKRAEEALREAHERAIWLARFPEQNPNPIIRASEDGTILYCNPASARLPGWKCEVGQGLPRELLPLVGRAMTEGSVVEDVQLSGTVHSIWVEPFPGEGYANIYGRDITLRKRAEERIARLTKLYVVLSLVNETIVRIHDEEGLLKEVCRIIAEEGGFPLVWIGLLKGRRVEPTASHGSAEDYLEEIKVEVDGNLGMGPTGTCIREDRPVINDDFDINPSTVPWREQALRYGFRASSAFPLHRQGMVIGALTIYAPNPGAFGIDQVNLFAALSADISYALNAIEQEKLRSKAEDSLRDRTLELQQLTDTLEQQVQERTEQLEVTNEELKIQMDECQSIAIDLRKSETSLRELSSSLLNAQERERKLIAGEIHDGLGASLAATKFKVETALNEIGEGNPQTKAALESVVPIIQGTIEEARRIQMSLRPSVLDDLGILATINWFCRQYESIYPNIRLRKEIAIQEQEVPEPLKIVIYRVLQEALNNIAKHSKASMVLLYLRKADQAIQLVIRDSGQGFDLGEVSSRKGSAKGLGLDSMRERTELSGGFFVVESRKGGAGTAIRATWPLKG